MSRKPHNFPSSHIRRYVSYLQEQERAPVTI